MFLQLVNTASSAFLLSLPQLAARSGAMNCARYYCVTQPRPLLTPLLICIEPSGGWDRNELRCEDDDEDSDCGAMGAPLCRLEKEK